MLSLDSLINITVNLPSEATESEDFSLGLILSQNNVISTADRVKTYSSTDEMISAGFASDSAEVIAAGLYFGQSKVPAEIAVGVQGTSETALEALTACRAANTKWYACTLLGAERADIMALAAYTEAATPAAVQFYTTSAASVLNGTTEIAALTVTSVPTTAGNVIITLNGVATTVALTLDMTTVAEAATAIRGASFSGWTTGGTGAIVTFTKSAGGDSSAPTFSAGTTGAAASFAVTPGSVCLALKAGSYRRSLGQYSSQDNAVAGIMGYACGASESSAYDLAYKSLTGVTAESLTTSQAAILQNGNCNYYTTYDNAYSFFWNGITADGSHFDEVINIDMMTADIQASILTVLMSKTKVPLTDSGMKLITTAISSVCANYESSGFIAAGTWNGEDVLNLSTGDTLSNGYSVQIEAVSTLTEAERAARQAPPIYVCIILAESGESFTITVNVER
jgi:hypothetical protein